MKQSKTKLIALMIAILMIFGLVAGCANQGENAAAAQGGGSILLRVNPEISIRYDQQGNVTSLKAKNKDASEIVGGVSGFAGRPSSEVISELVGKIHEAGYLVEEIEGERRQITIEIEKGSKMPNEEFMNGIIQAVQAYLGSNQLGSKLEIEGESEFGLDPFDLTDYDVTDFDDDTNYDDTNYTDDTGDTNYDDTGINMTDDNTDYDDDTDFDDKNDDDDTDYNKPVVTGSVRRPFPSRPVKYDDTDYDDTDYDDTDYDDTDYDDDTDYKAPVVTQKPTPKPTAAPAPTPKPTAAPTAKPTAVPTYDDTDYDDTDYDDTDYDDTDYDDTDYD